MPTTELKWAGDQKMMKLPILKTKKILSKTQR